MSDEPRDGFYWTELAHHPIVAAALELHAAEKAAAAATGNTGQANADAFRHLGAEPVILALAKTVVGSVTTDELTNSADEALDPDHFLLRLLLVGVQLGCRAQQIYDERPLTLPPDIAAGD